MEKIIELTIVTRKLRARFEAWAQDNSGATAVEFALIATPFFFLIFGLLEVSLIFIISTTLEFGLNDASRTVRTGSFQNGAAPTEAAFRTAVCANLFTLLECDQVKFDVRAFDNFNGGPPPPPIDPTTGEVDEPNFVFQPGAPNQIVIARAFYEWDLITPFISRPLSNLATGNSRLVQASIAFQNEPFNVAPTGP
jgi:Flp pilus assembly protein TadG